MRFVFALVALVAALVMIGAGVAQRTVLKPADHVTLQLQVPGDVRYVLVPGSVLTANSGRQRLQLSGAAQSFAADGRGSDVVAWLAGERYAQIGMAGDALKATVRTAPKLASVPPGSSPDPDGSDLWLDQRSGKGPLTWTMNVPSSVSVLVASDGASPAPNRISLNWPVSAATPWAVPLILIGGLLGVVGLLLYVWALVHVRRRRGPRRRPPAKLQRAPQPRYRSIRTPVTVTTRGRRSVRLRAAVVGGLILAVTAAGSPATAAPRSTAPSATAAVTDEQAARIVARAADVAAAADAKLNATLLATRFAGPALALRQAAYVLRTHSKKGKSAALPQAIPTAHAHIEVTLPQATTGWPRALFAIVTDGSDATVPPVALTLVQDGPRDDYTVRYETPLEPKAALPSLPSSSVGAPRMSSDSPLLRVQPDDLAAEYGMLLRKSKPDPAVVALFDLADDPLAAEVGVAAKKKQTKALGSTAKLVVDDPPTNPADVVAMSTAASGAIVAVDLNERYTVTPTASGAKVQTSGSVQTLSKVAETSKGIVSVYGYQLLFSVPSIGSKDPVRLLGYAQGLISAKEL